MGSNPRFLTLAGVVLLLFAGAAITFLSRNAARPEVKPVQAPARPAGMIAGIFDPPHPAPDFSLPGSDGSEVTLARYRGKVVLLSFGFTYCAAVCPTTLATLAQVRSKLGKAAASVQVIFVTVDPARDDAAHMRDYLKAFDPGFIGATGTPDALAAVREKYGVTAVRRGEGPDYAMDHTSSIFLIDRAGKLRAMMPFGHDPADFAHDIRLLLAE
ncbi:SCO family protein [Sphingomonas sp. LB-2]|uniref:SCO family protein n=1 Tax=Sphingomonas caeni TaxID=2984949 RepID=UPI0022300D5A|nr:SCO family protein [Sphingomonas caeni]MCW3846307.1 SCO family protein [Sphingomonas caeni]